MTGDPYRKCSPSKIQSHIPFLRQVSQLILCQFSSIVKKGECQYDINCPDNRACIENRCLDPCHTVNRPCAPNAECNALLHRPICRCPIGWAGNAHQECFKCRFPYAADVAEMTILASVVSDDCLKDDDCPESKACLHQQCVDVCSRTSCGERAVCEAKYHHAQCVCPPGLQGNPIVRCVDVGCLRDEDCNQREKCDYASQRCLPLCTGNACASGASCQARNHKEYCECIPPLRGDGFVFCEQRKCFSTPVKQKLLAFCFHDLSFLSSSNLPN